MILTDPADIFNNQEARESKEAERWEAVCKREGHKLDKYGICGICDICGAEIIRDEIDED
jgi:hypothetical protein